MASLTRSFLRPSMTNTIPLFLVPAFANASPVAAGQTAHFSTSTSLLGGPSAKRKQAYIRSKTMGRPNWTPTARPKIEKNKKRGVSAIRRTGPRSMRGLWKHALPEPVARDYRGLTPDYTESHDHGLWGFFDAKRQPMLEPDEESSHGMFELQQLQNLLSRRTYARQLRLTYTRIQAAHGRIKNSR